MPLHKYKYTEPFSFECGKTLNGVEVTYHTFGNQNKEKSNVVWICHAFSANSDPTDWWEGMVGEGKFFDPKKYFIVCVNMLGSCYGSTGPLSVNPDTGVPYYLDFPVVTVRDMVKTLISVRKELGIEKVFFATGFSMGGQQLLEWMIAEPLLFENVLLGATNIKHSPWGIAFNESQRLAIMADSTFGEHSPAAGAKGMKAARSIGLISYRNYRAYTRTQSEDDDSKIDNYKAASYQAYQGEKLVKRFNAYSYWYLSKAMDNHNICRNRGKAEDILASIPTRTCVVGIESDYLYPINEQEYLAEHMPNSTFVKIDSDFGHDGFLIEYIQLSEIIRNFMGDKLL